MSELQNEHRFLLIMHVLLQSVCLVYCAAAALSALYDASGARLFLCAQFYEILKFSVNFWHKE